jgi:hypothetical protein
MCPIYRKSHCSSSSSAYLRAESGGNEAIGNPLNRDRGAHALVTRGRDPATLRPMPVVILTFGVTSVVS